MRLSACLLLVALIGVVYGASLIGTWCIGVAVIADSITVGVYALLRDDGTNSSKRPVSGATEEQRFIAAVVDDKRRSA